MKTFAINTFFGGNQSMSFATVKECDNLVFIKETEFLEAKQEDLERKLFNFLITESDGEWVAVKFVKK